jgi:hypothetical protein
LLIAQSRQFLVALGRADVQPSIFDSLRRRRRDSGVVPTASRLLADFQLPYQLADADAGA